MRKSALLVFLAALNFGNFIFNSFSQAPQSFNYQLIARDTAGLVLSNKTLGIQISILQNSANGAVVYSERHSATTNNYGLANLTIGTGSIISGSFGAIDWAHHTHFLKLEIDPSGGLNYFTMGTTQLVSVPYSIYAENAGTLTDTNLTSKWTQTGDDIYNNNSGNVGIGIDAPAGKLIVKGDSMALASEPLFEVKNKDGDPVFVVYPDSVRIIISQSASKANAQGGFAVSGRSSSKGSPSDYLRVTPDSTRIYTGDTIAGFGVKNIGATSKTSYMQLTPNNYFMGHEAGKSISTGLYNSFIGYQAGYSDTSGSKNYFIGYNAGYNNSNGYSNIFLGDNCGYSNKTGYSNIFLGDNCGYSNTIGYQNVFLGRRAGYSNTSGWGNTANGFQALYSNTIGLHNVANGYQALYSNTSGSYNVANGYQALYFDTTGSYNVANGYAALYSNITGFYNVANGYQALYSNTIGGYNVANGYQALYSNIEGNANTATGHGALYFNTGYGNTATGSCALVSNTTGNWNTATGIYSLYSNTTGTENTALGYGALYSDTTGNDNTALGYWAYGTGSYYNSTALGANSIINQSNKVRFGDANVTVIEGQVAYTFPSDGRFKNNIAEEVKGLDFITRLRPIIYNFDTRKFDAFLLKNLSDSLRNAIMSKKDYSESSSIRQTGFIAQEIEYAAKECGYDFNGVHKPENENDNYSVAYSLLTVPLVKAVQEQQEQIEQLKNENILLKGQIQEFENLKAEIEYIKTILGASAKK